MRKTAIVLFNLGGPDRLESVRPFLFNLFNDAAIIQAPTPIRWLIAQLISRTREKSAQANYALMGGKSPLLEQTQAQADALQAAIAGLVPDRQVRCFVAMRHWHPMTQQTAQAVRDWGAQDVLCLPLYPQFSTTTTGSSMQEWARHFGEPTHTLCCWPDESGFAQSHASAILETWEKAGRPQPMRVLFSAHGLPEKIIRQGDPYQAQVEASVAAISALLPPELQVAISYQSRVGPLKWIGPATEDEIERAGAEQIGLLVVPVAFVSEHIETLVELDDEYAEKAHHAGVPTYLRVPALSVREDFIAALAGLAVQALERAPGCASYTGQRVCAASHHACPMRGAGVQAQA